MVGVPRGEFFTTDYTDYTDFFIFSREFALFAVDFGSAMRNPKEPICAINPHRAPARLRSPIRRALTSLRCATCCKVRWMTAKSDPGGVAATPLRYVL